MHIDKTRIVQEKPLILQSDKHNPRSSYFGYFPPNSKEPELVLIDNDLNKIRNAANWSAWKTSKSAGIVKIQNEAKIKIVPIEGKGLGMVATGPIYAGELIYQER